MNKEEIEKAKIHNLLNDIKTGFRDVKEYKNILYPLEQSQYIILINYIQELEEREQKVKDKCKENISLYKKHITGCNYCNNSCRYYGLCTTQQKILNLLEGEKE